MSRFVSLLRREPVRIYLYGVSIALIAILMAVGLVSATLAPLILALVTAVLAVPTAETLRNRVTPYPPVREVNPHISDSGTVSGDPL